MGFVGWIFFLFTFSRVKGVVFNDNNEYLSDSFQHFFSTTSFGGSTDFYEYPKPEVLSAMFYFISGTTVFLAGAFYFFYTKSHKTLFQNLCTYSLEGNLSDPFKKTLLFLLSLSICVGAFYGFVANYYLTIQFQDGEFRWIKASADAIQNVSSEVYLSLKEMNFTAVELMEFSRFYSFTTHFTALAESWQTYFSYFGDLRKVLTDAIFSWYCIFSFFVVVSLIFYRKRLVAFMFLFSLIFFIGICLAGGFNHSILIYHIRFCNNYPNNVRQALGYNITDSEFNNFRECNDEDDPNDDPFLETTNIILRKFNNNQSTEKERKALEEILTLLNTLRCNGSIFVDYNSSSGPGRFATGFKKLYYDENEIICIRSIIDLGVLQIVFISSVLCAGIILFTFAIPLRNNEEWETISNRRRNDDFYTIDSNFRRKSTLEDSGDQTDAMSLNSPVVNEKESLLSPK